MLKNITGWAFVYEMLRDYLVDAITIADVYDHIRLCSANEIITIESELEIWKAESQFEQHASQTGLIRLEEFEGVLTEVRAEKA